MAKYENKKKEQQIEHEIKRLNTIFKFMDDDKKEICEGLIEEASFMRSTLFDLKKDIKSDGAIDEMQQGDYIILRQHPAVQAYNTTIRNYANVISKLLAMLPEKMAAKVESDEFEDLMADR